MIFMDYKAQKPNFEYLHGSLASFCAYIDLTINVSTKVHSVFHCELHIVNLS